MENLGYLPDGWNSEVIYVRADGLVVVAESNRPVGDTHFCSYRAFFRTSGGGKRDIGTIDTNTHSFAIGVSPDGRVVVGASWTERPGGVITHR
jgi:uncharacterized membrane protein